jgi:hypothetical protein
MAMFSNSFIWWPVVLITIATFSRVYVVKFLYSLTILIQSCQNPIHCFLPLRVPTSAVPEASLLPVSLMPVVHLDLRISLKIKEKIWNDPFINFRGLGEDDSRKKPEAKIMWHCPFYACEHWYTKGPFLQWFLLALLLVARSNTIHWNPHCRLWSHSVHWLGPAVRHPWYYYLWLHCKYFWTCVFPKKN